MTARRAAALYDVHGNLPALEAVLAELADVAPDALVVVGGDFANGPFPAQTVDLLRSLGERAVFISGNGERELIEGRVGADGGWAARTAWIGERLDDERRAFLARLPATVSLDVEGLGDVLFCHGSPRSDEEIVTSLTPDERLRPMLAGVQERVVVVGHTHGQFDRVVDGTRVVNAGSVGMPYEDEPGAYWALLGSERTSNKVLLEGEGVALRRTTYGLEEAAERIRASGFPAAHEFVAEFVLGVTAGRRREASEYFERLAARGS